MEMERLTLNHPICRELLRPITTSNIHRHHQSSPIMAPFEVLKFLKLRRLKLIIIIYEAIHTQICLIQHIITNHNKDIPWSMAIDAATSNLCIMQIIHTLTLRNKGRNKHNLSLFGECSLIQRNNHNLSNSDKAILPIRHIQHNHKAITM